MVNKLAGISSAPWPAAQPLCQRSAPECPQPPLRLESARLSSQLFENDQWKYHGYLYHPLKPFFQKVRRIFLLISLLSVIETILKYFDFLEELISCLPIFPKQPVIANLIFFISFGLSRIT